MLHYQPTLRTAPLSLHGVIRANALLILLSATLMLLTTCVAGGTPSPRNPVGGQPADIASALVELDAMQTPEGVDARVFQELKDALASALHEQAGKAASRPPRGTANAITDFSIHSESGQLGLLWHYRNNGDYDQDGVVGIADITPLAVHFNEAAYDDNSIEGIIDGSGNNKIDIADITPIAQNFGVQCDGYVVQNSTTPDGGFSSFQSFAFSTGGGMGRKIFMPVVPEAAGHYYRVRPFNGTEVGDGSNVIQWGAVE